MKKYLITGLILFFSSINIANATIIINSTTTTDTAQGLEFLHIPEYTVTADFATASAGITLGGFSWDLATADQFINLMSNVTGVALPAWNGSNHGDTNFSSAQADAMMASLGYGLNSITDGPWVWLALVFQEERKALSQFQSRVLKKPRFNRGFFMWIKNSVKTKQFFKALIN